MSEKGDLLPSEVRARVLCEHACLRARMDAVRRAARSGGDVAAALADLFDAMLRTIELEHELLLPTLRTIDAWGAERARRLAAWHLAVRDRVACAQQEVAGRPPDELRVRAIELVAELSRELTSEERTHLSQELLRELPIPADLGGD